MIDPKNMGTLTCGLTRDPEIKSDVAIFSLAADYAGYEKGSDNRSGYFDGRVLLKTASCADFVRSQIEKGNLKKGSQIVVAYRLSHDRWTGDDGKRSRVSLVIEGMSYASSGGGGNTSSSKEASSGGGSESSVHDDFPEF